MLTLEVMKQCRPALAQLENVSVSMQTFLRNL